MMIESSNGKKFYTNQWKKWVSFSQFSNWFNCRHRWYLDHVKGLREFEDNVNTCFGRAMNEGIQLYIETLYKKSCKGCR